MKTNVIREARLSKGYSQNDISMDIDMSQSQYSRRESGLMDFSLKEIRQLCEILELDLKDTIIALIADPALNTIDNQSKRKEIQSREILAALHKLIEETTALSSVVKEYTDD